MQSTAIKYSAIGILIFIFIAVLFTGFFSGILNYRHDYTDVADAIAADDPFASIKFAYRYFHDESVRENILYSLGASVAIILFFVIIIFIPKQKGIYGSAHFSRFSELMKANLFVKSGIILGKFGSKYLINNEAKHILVVGPTRSGKGVGFVIPNLLVWEGSFICLDLKQENFEACAAERLRKKNKLILFAPGQKQSNCYNPLDYISSDPAQRINDIQKISLILIEDPISGTKMWAIEARSLLQGLISYILESKSFDGKRNLGNVNRLLMTKTDTRTFLKWLLYDQDLSEFTRNNFNNFINKAEKERSGVKSGVTSSLQIWQNPLVDSATRKSDFDLRDLRKKKISIFIGVNSSELSLFAPLINLFFQQASNVLSQKIPKSDEPYQVLFMIDEFASLGNMEVILNAMPYLAGYKLRLALIIQNLSQLDKNYKKEGRDIIIGNSAIQTFLAFNDQTTPTYVSTAMGNKTIETKSISKRKAKGSPFFEKTFNLSKTGVPLMRPEELRHMSANKQIILLQGASPVKAKKIKFYNDIKLKKMARIKGQKIHQIPSNNISNSMDVEMSKLVFKYNQDAQC